MGSRDVPWSLGISREAAVPPTQSSFITPLHCDGSSISCHNSMTWHYSVMASAATS